VNLPIITADQRLAEPRGIKGCIFGKSGIGKTSLLWTLDPARTLFMDLEAGDLAIEGWPGDSIRPRTWAECRDFAVFIGGANPSLRDEQPYSPAHHAAVCTKFGDPAAVDRFETIFVDSITVAGRLCFQWCKGQPEALSEKTGKPDVRGAYGLHGREMIGWLTHCVFARSNRKGNYLSNVYCVFDIQFFWNSRIHICLKTKALNKSKIASQKLICVTVIKSNCQPTLSTSRSAADVEAVCLLLKLEIFNRAFFR